MGKASEKPAESDAKHSPSICMECRIRTAIQQLGPDDPPQPMTVQQMEEGANAMAEILAEILAHGSEESAMRFVQTLLVGRVFWRLDARLAIHQPAQGSA